MSLFHIGGANPKLESSIASITQDVKSIKVVTQAEYDALPSTKLTDNTLYLIKG